MTSQTVSIPFPQRGDSVEALLARGQLRRTYGVGLTLASRNTATYSTAIETYGFNRLFLYMNTTVSGGGTGILPIVQYQNPSSGTWHTLTQVSGFLTGLGWFLYGVGPGAYGTHSSMSSGLQGHANLQLPGTIRVGIAWGSVTFYTSELHWELLS